MTFDDARVKFYLQHRDQLQEWFDLRPDVAAAMDDWLLALDVRALAKEIGADVEVFAETADDQAWPAFYFYRTSWRHVPGDGAVLVGVGVQWGRGRTLLGESTTPYVGLMCRNTTEIGLAVRRDADFQKARKQWKANTTPWWAAYSYVRVADDEPFPEQADAYRSRLVDAIRRAWADYAPVVDRAVATASTAGQQR